MNEKERGRRTIGGLSVDRAPVAGNYAQLVYRDHFAELTGEAAWRAAEWTDASPERHLEVYRRMVEAVPFEILQPWSWAPSRETRERTQYVVKDGQPFRHDTAHDTWTPVEPPESGHAQDYAANERRHIYDRADIGAAVPVAPAAERIAEGANDYIDAVVSAFGEDHYILSGGVIGTVYSCHGHVGLTNLYAMLVEEPDFIDELSSRLLEQNIEEIRRLAAAGGDAIYIDDAMTTSDMISPAHYERFSLPHVTAMVNEIHALGHQAILIYFGGVSDRLELIASTGADALCMECSMKGYINDMADAARSIGGQMTLFANIDPVSVIERGSDDDLEAEMRRQVDASRAGRGFVIAPSSPITPGTTVARMQRFIEMGIQLGAAEPVAAISC